MATPTTYTGENAAITIATKTHSTLGLSDFTLTLSRDTIETELVGESGNDFRAGSLTVEGSLTATKLDNNAAGTLLEALLNGTYVTISGSAGTNSLHFYFASGLITGFEITLGDANTVSEGSIDFTVVDAHNVTKTALATGGVKIHD